MKRGLTARLVMTGLVLLLGGYTQAAAPNDALNTAKSIEDADPERLTAARAFLAATKARETLIKALRTYPPRSEDYAARFVPQLSDEASRQAFRDAFERVKAAKMEQAIARLGELVDLTAAAYARYYSTAELNMATEFFEQPAGQKFLAIGEVALDRILRPQPEAELERLEAARALVDILKQADPVIAALGNPAELRRADADGIEAEAKGPPDQSAEENEAAKRFENLAAFYANSFTVKELETLIAFYESPLGQKVGFTPQDLEVEIINLGTQWFWPFLAELEAELAETLAKRGDR